jgi:hypothetical protein
MRLKSETDRDDKPSTVCERSRLWTTWGSFVNNLRFALLYRTLALNLRGDSRHRSFAFGLIQPPS